MNDFSILNENWTKWWAWRRYIPYAKMQLRIKWGEIKYGKEQYGKILRDGSEYLGLCYSLGSVAYGGVENDEYAKIFRKSKEWVKNHNLIVKRFQ